ncbi:MAG: LPS export ABC transporter periplasmic protein LptC [Candidatus Hydrothermales bacterium]
MDKRKTLAMDTHTSKILITFLAIFLLYCEEKKVKEIKLVENLEETKKVKIVEYKEKEKTFELYSEDIITKENVIRAKDVEIVVYNKGLKTLLIKSNFAIYREKEGILILEDNVKIWNSEGDTLWAKEIIYDYEKGIIKSNSPCELFQKGKLIKGEGFESKKPFKKIKILGKVKGISR